MTYMVIDLETAISNTVHGPSGVYPENDFYTCISKIQGKSTKLHHEKRGFSRKLPVDLEGIDVLIGHNIKFDLLYFWEDVQFQAFLARGGYVIDTQVMEYPLTGQRHKMSSLAELQEKYLGEKQKKDRISYLFSKKIGADKILNKRGIDRIQGLYNQYCYSDGESTEKIFLLQYAKAQKENMWDIIRMYCKDILVLAMMEHNGLPFDLELIKTKMQAAGLKGIGFLEEATSLVKEFWIGKHLPPFNIRSNDHLSAALYGGIVKNKVRLRDGEYKNGNPKFKLTEVETTVAGFGVKPKEEWKGKKEGVHLANKVVLKEITESGPGNAAQFCSLILESRLVNKLVNTYYPAYLERAIHGRVHPTYQNTQTITGRLSCTKPNLQNIPTGGVVEALIQPEKEGWVCCRIDYSQLEVYTLGYQSGCQRLINDIEAGLDLHSLSLAGAMGESYEKTHALTKTDKKFEKWRKTIGKPITFGIQYGAAVKTIAKNAEISEKQATEAVDNYYGKYPEIRSFFEGVREEIERSAVFSKKADVNKFERKILKHSRRFSGDIELLPIKDWDTDTTYHTAEYPRQTGYYRSLTGRKYSFDSDGSVRRGTVVSNFRQPIIQNYCNQGLAEDVQCASGVSLLPYLLENKDKVELVNEIHDCKDFLICKDALQEVVNELQYHMTIGYKKVMKEILGINFELDLKVDVEIGNNFGELFLWEK
jgi:DNA polymerase I-like protein with 3'-5' exonuclease and polymerase domains